MDQKTKDSVMSYLEKSYNIIQRQTQTNKILADKNRELLAKNIFYQTKIKILKDKNKELKKKLESINTSKSNTENEFEIL
jgi:hypothetical protein